MNDIKRPMQLLSRKDLLRRALTINTGSISDNTTIEHILEYLEPLGNIIGLTAPDMDNNVPFITMHENGNKEMSMRVVDHVPKGEYNFISKACITPDTLRYLEVGGGLAADIRTAAGYEIGLEISKIVMQELVTKNTKRVTEVQTLSELLLSLHKTSNEIAKKTRRGSANIVVIPCDLLALINMISPDQLVRVDNKTNIGNSGCLLYAGILCSKWHVYVDVYDLMETARGVLLGYQGDTKRPFVDGGLGCILNSITFQDDFKVDTLYGDPARRWEINMDIIHNDSNMNKGIDYYQLMEFNLSHIVR